MSKKTKVKLIIRLILWESGLLGYTCGISLIFVLSEAELPRRSEL
ncbi:hypothetical protein ACFLV9_00455 [Chloroflexota bacterium]